MDLCINVYMLLHKSCYMYNTSSKPSCIIMLCSNMRRLKDLTGSSSQLQNLIVDTISRNRHASESLLFKKALISVDRCFVR